MSEVDQGRGVPGSVPSGKGRSSSDRTSERAHSRAPLHGTPSPEDGAVPGGEIRLRDAETLRRVMLDVLWRHQRRSR